ncbi:hypothetical protein N1F89_14615 [Aquibium sp. A9E412]|uniref:sodium:solute symporter family transporter n=1 Tax=Aquibium sp. A9E412 TaxID=2976767 RepID=UPI0025B067E0|nr:hypothetical protein [Aquibium sp. A9E412]MDN2567454.1 hypothetical protein [Aquibium sp. A9E412]
MTALDSLPARRRFPARPRRLFGTIAVGLVALAALAVALERLGVGAQTITLLLTVYLLAAVATVALAARSMTPGGVLLADRRVPAFWNGLALAGGALGGATLVALAGGPAGEPALAAGLALGLPAGLVLAGVLLAPQLRRAGAVSVPDFLAMRYGAALRPAGLAVLLVACFVLLTVQIDLLGRLAAVVFGLSPSAARWAGLVAVLVCVVPGGMRSVTWTQAALSLVLIIALLAVAAWLTEAAGLGFVPHLTLGEAAARAAATPAGPGAALPGAADAFALAATALCAACGIAAMPHVLLRFLAAASGRTARRTASHALVWGVVLFTVLPVLALLAQRAALDFAAVGTPDAAALSGMALQADTAFIALPALAGLPAAAGALALVAAAGAALAVAAGLLMAMAGALSHDLHHRMLDPRADAAVRLLLVRLFAATLGALAVPAAGLAIAGTLPLAVWALSLAASGLFVPLVLGVWWRRANGPGALAGLVAGTVAAGGYLYHLAIGGAPWFGIDAMRVGLVGLAASLLATIGVSLLTPPPGPARQAFVRRIRLPARGRDVPPLD